MTIQTRLEFTFAGIPLPVAQTKEGLDIVPLKPIADIFGLDWKNVYDRMQIPYYTRRLGVCMGDIPHAGQNRQMVCIRLDRVAAYLNQINPESVRGGGNAIGADFLETKQSEWDDLIHQYELRTGGVLQTISTQTRTKALHVRLFLQVLRAKKETPDGADRQALCAIAKDLAQQAGAAYQPDLAGV